MKNAQTLAFIQKVFHNFKYKLLKLSNWLQKQSLATGSKENFFYLLIFLFEFVFLAIHSLLYNQFVCYIVALKLIFMPLCWKCHCKRHICPFTAVAAAFNKRSQSTQGAIRVLVYFYCCYLIQTWLGFSRVSIINKIYFFARR